MRCLRPDLAYGRVRLQLPQSGEAGVCARGVEERELWSKDAAGTRYVLGSDISHRSFLGSPVGAPAARGHVPLYPRSHAHVHCRTRTQTGSSPLSTSSSCAMWTPCGSSKRRAMSPSTWWVQRGCGLPGAVQGVGVVGGGGTGAAHDAQAGGERGGGGGGPASGAHQAPAKPIILIG